MTMHRLLRGALPTAALLALLPPVAAAQTPGPVIAIRDATIVPVTAPRIARGTVLIRGSQIAAVGADVAIPAGATVIDGSGLTVYPGMIDSGTQLGLVEIASVPGSTDTEELGTFNPHNDALTAVNPHSELIPVDRVNGITTVITSAGGGLISGTAALIDLDGWTGAEMAVRPRAGMVVTWPRSFGGGRGGFGGGGRGQQGDAAERVSRQVRELHEYFAEARSYARQKESAHAQGTTLPRTDLPFEAMIPVLQGELPVIVNADDADQIRGALALADSFQVKVIIRGGSEAWRLADTLAARRVPVIVGPLTRAPGEDDPYDMIYANPGVLAKAGVVIAFQTDDAADARNLPFNAGLATAYGLDPEQALAALTINPARIWGVDKELGSIEAGKVANLIVTTGDPLDVRTTLTHLFIRGTPVELTDRHTKLYEQFRARPKNNDQ